MEKILLFIVSTLMALPLWAQKTIVSGTVGDAVTGKAIGGASITAGKWSVVTNDDGFFTLKTDEPVATVTASHVGYQPQQAKVGPQGSAPLNIKLKPATILLDEVLVTADNARMLVNKAISPIPANYGSKPELYRCFYRETAMKRQHYICVAEGVVDMYKTDYQQGVERDRVAISKGRRLLSPKRSDTLSVKVLGGPVTPIALDVVKNRDFLLNKDELDLYDLKMDVPTTIGGRRQYVVSVAPVRNAPYALYFGRLYIDQETLAFTRAELTLDMSDRQKATQMMLVKKPAGVRFKPKELSLLADYRLGTDGVTRISYLRTTFRFNCDWRRRLFATSFAASCEMAVTSSDDSNAQPIPGRSSFDQRDAFYDKVDYFRDPTFWQDYNIIEPTVSLDKAVHKLLKKTSP